MANRRSKKGYVPEPRGGSPEVRAGAETLFGLRACLAVHTRRPSDILRVAHSAAVRREVAALVRWAGARGVPCGETNDAELTKLAESNHHEGLCALVRPRRWLSTAELCGSLVERRGVALALDRVRNPYNVGAVVRTAAFLGVDAVVLGAPAPHPGLSPAAVRVAEGGAEHVQWARTTDLADTLGRFRSHGVRVVGTDASAGAPSGGFGGERPIVLVVGNEREGLGERVRSQCDAMVGIRGTGAVESLNVAIATGILLATIVATPSSGQTIKVHEDANRLP